ncbi:MAG: glycolate oxidase subunit GlcE [Gammaproteobacteria bacterium]|nr:glycolate oxidase subunit GlcE [Gammaproteobacteria bacterium]MDH5736313.1 glycolate oxidase subunit GlcE [Gammaproteobacteria bacterium]
MNTDISQQLQQQVVDAFEQASPLCIVGGNSKSFYGRTVSTQTLNIESHRGVLNYEPTELVITVRAGTRLIEIETLLAEHGQMLAFEPPAFSPAATIGGTIACNLSGPRRAYTGAARDYLLGCKIINGKGEILSFGGEVMKNVAGYDVSRLMAGAMGTLGVLLEVSLKVLPRPEKESTQFFQCSTEQALEKIHALSQTPLPLSASCFNDGQLQIRLSGTTKAVNAAIETIGGDTLNNANDYWLAVKEQTLDFFNTEKSLWRISIASDTKSLPLQGEYLYEWGGALRWLKSNETAELIQNTVAAVDGHACLFRHNHHGLFQPLTPGLMRIHKNLKQAFDPANILNPGKLYPEL